MFGKRICSRPKLQAKSEKHADVLQQLRRHVVWTLVGEPDNCVIQEPMVAACYPDLSTCQIKVRRAEC